MKPSPALKLDLMLIYGALCEIQTDREKVEEIIMQILECK